MDVILTRGVGIRGVGYPAGAQVSVSDADGKMLIQLGKAMAVPTEKDNHPVSAETIEGDQSEQATSSLSEATTGSSRGRSGRGGRGRSGQGRSNS